MSDPGVDAPDPDALQAENVELRARLAEAEETLRAIREGEVDAIVVSGSQGDQVFSLTGTEHVYRLIVETMKEAALTVTTDGQILFCNGQFGAFVRTPLERIVGRPLAEFVVPVQRPLMATILMQSQTASVTHRLTFQGSEGPPVPAHVSATVLCQPDGLSICLVATDLSELETSTEMLRQLRKQQDALSESHAILHAVIESTTDFVFLKDPQGRYLAINSAAAHAIGRPATEILGRDDSVLFPPEIARDIIAKDRRVFAAGTAEIFEESFPVAGQVRHLLTAKNVCRDATGKVLGLVGIARDITERKQAEEALRSAYHTLERQLAERMAALTETGQRLQVPVPEHELTAEEIRRLGQALERRASELVALDKVGRALTLSLDLAAILRLLLPEVRSLLGAEGAGVMQYDPQRDDLVFLAAEGGGLEALLGQRVPAAHSIVGEVVRERRTAVVLDVPADPRFYEKVPGLSQLALRSLVAVPLIARGQVIGVLGVINKQDGVFSEADGETLAAIATSAAIAIENAQLYAAAQTRRHQLEAVRFVTAEITRELDLPTLLARITRHARDLLDAGTATIWLWDEEAQLLIPQIPPGHPPWFTEMRLRLGEGLVGLVAEQRAGRFVNEYLAWPQAVPVAAARGTITAVVAEPLLYHDRLLGVLSVDNEETSRTFATEDSDLLALFASHAAIALQNARLFGQAQADQARMEQLSRRLVDTQEAERRHIGRELHDEVGQSLTALKLVLDMSARSSPDKGKANLAEAQTLVSDVLSQVRELSLQLRPAMLDDLGLLPALVWLFDRYQARTQVQVLARHTGVEGRRFPGAVETAAYRIVQEALTNVARHAKVHEATIRLWAGPDTLGVQIEDRGAGFDPAIALAKHFSSGLAGMRERAGLLGGTMTVDSAPGAGTTVTAEFPLGPSKDGAREAPGAGGL